MPHPAAVKRAESVQLFTAALGSFIIAWNNAENSMRVLLATLCGHSYATDVLTVELGSRGLIEGLNAMARTLPKERREAVEIVVKLYDRIREYRNYYAHGIRVFLFSLTDHSAIGIANLASAKGKLATSEDRITTADITKMSAHCTALQSAIGAIIDTINPRAGSRADPPLPSQQTLLLPDRLKKTLRYYLNAQHPPESSDG